MTGWYILEVMRKDRGGRNDWVALLVDVDPDADDDYQPVQSHWLDLGRHKTRDDAYDHAESMMATRH